MAYSWTASNSSSSESSSYGTEGMDFSGNGDDSEEEPANDVSDGCTCRCKDHNQFTVRAAQTLVTVERDSYRCARREVVTRTNSC